MATSFHSAIPPFAPLAVRIVGVMVSTAATGDDVEAVADTITLAFLHDPVWGPALARADGSMSHHAGFWRCYVEGALRYSTVFMTDDASAVAVWTPPGGTELSELQEAEARRIIQAGLEPEAAAALFQLWERFDSSRPRDDPHAYLGLLATHPARRGQGIGQALLAENLRDWDAQGIPAYLESTNPANDHRYARAGFQPIGGFTAVLDSARVTTMWRAVPSS
jgi:GNAT superfamily N-acetyltransferase